MAIVLAGCFALLAVGLRISIHAALSPYALGADYRLGCVQGVGIDLLIGFLVLSPLLLSDKAVGRWSTYVLTVAAFAGYASAAHYHCVFNRLPGWESVGALTSLGPLKVSLTREAPLWLLAGEVLVPSAILILLSRLLSRRKVASSGSRRGSMWIPALVVALALLSIAQLIGLRGQRYNGCIGPYGYLLSHLRLRSAETELSLDEVQWVQERLGVEVDGPPPDPAYPLQRPWRAGSAPLGKRRSVIMLVLESVGAREMFAEHQGVPLMPNLRRIADASVLFPNIYAPGYRSGKALVALFTGVPAITTRNVLMHPPIPHMLGYPRELQKVGYETVYAHGGDLSFEQQRDFLRMVGFETLLEPDPLRDDLAGWCLPDAEVFGRLQARLSSLRAKRGERTLYLAGMATMSTHHPFVLPPSTPPRFEGEDPFDRFASCLLYSDAALGAFYDWYLEHEAPHGTVLLITGDHAPPLGYPGEALTAAGYPRERFGVPLLIAGLEPAELERARAVSDRVGGHHDLPQTILGLVGLDVPNSFQGRDLLDTKHPWRRRFVVSVSGEELQFLFVRDGSRRWTLKGNEPVELFDTGLDPELQRNLLRPTLEAELVSTFGRRYRTLCNYLTIEDRFAPPRRSKRSRPLPRVSRPQLVSHRGNTIGPGTGPRENSLESLEAAIAAGFAWIEIDVRMTRDELPIVFHDEAIKVGEQAHSIHELSLAELRALPLDHRPPTLQEFSERCAGRIGLCVELKPCPIELLRISNARAAVRVLSKLPDTRMIVDSFSDSMLSTVKAFSALSTALDLPQRPPPVSWLDYAADKGFAWVYVRFDLAGPELVRQAHSRGLRVMLYDANDRADLETRFGEELPDGIMTDVASPWGALLGGQ